MTKHSKCEVCRARKIKCDETRPKCGPCEKKGRACVYKNENDDVFVHEQIGALRPTAQHQTGSPSTSRSSSYRSDSTENPVERGESATAVNLRLKRSRKADTGSGEFLTFGRPRKQQSKVKAEPFAEDQGHASPHRRRSTLSPSPLSMPSRPQDLLAARWMSIAGTESLNLYPLGNWVKLAWARVGCNSYLDLAVEYTLSAMTAFRQQSQKDFIKISSIGGRAMRSLRQAIMSGEKVIDVYVAVMLHYAAEHFRGMKSCYWVSHMSAVSQLLASKIPETDEEETVHSIIHATREDEVGEAILNGQLSMLENLTIPTTVLGSLELDISLNELDRLLVKLPRLVLLVRAATENPDDSAASGQAIALAQELHSSNETLAIEQTVSNVMERMKMTPTSLPSLPVASSLHFDSIPEFVLATRYFLLQLLLSGLIQSICDLEHANTSFDRSAAEAKDIWAALSIFQCVEWAFRPEAGVHLTMLRMLIPLQLGFGAWHRLERRQTSLESPEYHQALRMKDVTIELTNQIDVRWGNRITAAWRLGPICDMFAGGPLFEWMYNYRNCGNMI